MFSMMKRTEFFCHLLSFSVRRQKYLIFGVMSGITRHLKFFSRLRCEKGSSHLCWQQVQHSNPSKSYLKDFYQTTSSLNKASNKKGLFKVASLVKSKKFFRVIFNSLNFSPFTILSFWAQFSNIRSFEKIFFYHYHNWRFLMANHLFHTLPR